MPRRALIAVFLLLTAIASGLVAACGDDDTPTPPRTIVLITIDTLRWDHVSAYAPKSAEDVEPQTPHIDRLAARSLRFEDARTPVPLTLPAHTTMLAGLPPAVTGVRLNTYGHLPARARRGYPLLPEVLRDHGWETAAFVSAAVLGKRYGLDQAFHRYGDGGLADTSKASVAQRDGAETVAQAVTWLYDRPPDAHVFLWLHIFEPHAPYERTGHYAGDVAAADTIIGSFLEGLAATRGEDTAILLTSDHGEALGELHERSHGFLLADGVLRVPFLLRVPGRRAAVRTDPADLADVAPTLAGLAGVPWTRAATPGAGLDLLAGPAPPDRIRFAESLYGHQVHRGAQLTAAQGKAGTLIDVGKGRTFYVPTSGWQQIRRDKDLPRDTAAIRALDQSLAKYRHSEKADRLGSGNESAGGYGGGGPVTPFLTGEENARLPDPHGLMDSHLQLDQIKAQVLNRRLPPKMRRKALEAALKALRALDRPHLLGGSPELAFWLGETWKELGLVREGAGPGFKNAEKAYLKAFQLGRKDTETLCRACGADAMGREVAMLERLESLGKQVPRLGCPYWILRAAWTRVAEREGALPEGSGDRACAEAEAHCRSARDRKRWLGTCR